MCSFEPTVGIVEAGGSSGPGPGHWMGCIGRLLPTESLSPAAGAEEGGPAEAQVLVGRELGPTLPCCCAVGDLRCSGRCPLRLLGAAGASQCPSPHIREKQGDPARCSQQTGLGPDRAAAPAPLPREGLFLPLRCFEGIQLCSLRSVACGAEHIHSSNLHRNLPATAQGQ